MAKGKEVVAATTRKNVSRKQIAKQRRATFFRLHFMFTIAWISNMKQAIEHENISPNVIAIPIKGLPMDNWSWTGDLGHSHLGPASISGSDLKEDGSKRPCLFLQCQHTHP